MSDFLLIGGLGGVSALVVGLRFLSLSRRVACKAKRGLLRRPCRGPPLPGGGNYARCCPLAGVWLVFPAWFWGVFFFSPFCRACCFFLYLCPWFSGLSRVGFSLPLGLFRGVGVRLLRRVRLVRSVRPARAARAVLPVFGARGGGVSAFCLVAVRSAGVFVVGRLGGCVLVRLAGWRVGVVGRCCRPWCPVVFVFLIFFNSGWVWAARMPPVLRRKKVCSLRKKNW